MLWCTHIARVADAVATNGDSGAVRVILVWLDFTYKHGMAYFLPLVQRDVVVLDAKQFVGTATHLELVAFSKPMPWQIRSSSLEYKVSHVVLYQGSCLSWQCSSILPVVGQELIGPMGCPCAKEQSKERQSWLSQLLSCDAWCRDPQTSLLQEESAKIWLLGCSIGRIHEIALLKQRVQVRLVPGICCGGL
jgi:hypothetical protein